MRLAGLGTRRLDDIRIDGALRQPADIRVLRSFLIEDVDKWVMRARDAEVAGLAATEHFRTAKNRLDDATKYLGGAEKRAAGLRQSPLLPDGLRPRLAEIENEIIDLQVRTRLHVASLYTVRGSYGSALSYVNGALAYDPVNEQALAARARIEEAAAVSSLRGFGRLIR